jgi:hypothetical protein
MSIHLITMMVQAGLKHINTCRMLWQMQVLISLLTRYGLLRGYIDLTRLLMTLVGQVIGRILSS